MLSDVILKKPWAWLLPLFVFQELVLELLLSSFFTVSTEYITGESDSLYNISTCTTSPGIL